MTNATVHVVARIVAKAGTEAAMRELLLTLIEPTRREAGCISYRLLESVENPTEFVFIEEWIDDSAIDAHMAMAYVHNMIIHAQSLLAAAPFIQRHRLLS